MNQLLHYTVGDWLDLAAKIMAVASVLRIGLHWLRGLLAISIGEGSKFWLFYDKLELSLTYISVSLAAYGKKKVESSAEAPVTKSLGPGEGKIK